MHMVFVPFTIALDFWRDVPCMLCGHVRCILLRQSLLVVLQSTAVIGKSAAASASGEAKLYQKNITDYCVNESCTTMSH